MTDVQLTPESWRLLERFRQQRDQADAALDAVDATTHALARARLWYNILGVEERYASYASADITSRGLPETLAQRRAFMAGRERFSGCRLRR